MELYEKIEADMRSSLKEGNAGKLSVLRMLVAAIRQFEIDKNVKAPAEADVLQIVSRQIKQHKESIEQFNKGSRPDLAEKEAAELKILEVYMPAQMSEADLLTLVRAAISESGAVTKAETGKVMKLVMEKAKGKADGKTVNALVMKLLK
jgi:uncharacterized protein